MNPKTCRRGHDLTIHASFTSGYARCLACNRETAHARRKLKRVPGKARNIPGYWTSQAVKGSAA